MKNFFLLKQYSIILLSALLFVLFLLPSDCSAVPLSEKSSCGPGVFSISEKTGVNNDMMKVFYYRPYNWNPGRPVMLVQRGVQRNAADYRDELIKCAEDYNILIVCPEFSKEKYPGARYYNLANIAVGKQIQPENQWTFSVISDVIAEIDKRFTPHGKIVLFGHSAGAQFIHRYMLFASMDKRISQIIIANAGWYTMPDDNISFPYGIKNTPLNDGDLTADFTKPVTILLGEDDIHADSNVLRHTNQADAQGSYRFERGIAFFNEAMSKAGKLDVPFNWQLITVSGVGHDDAKMAAAAAELICK